MTTRPVPYDNGELLTCDRLTSITSSSPVCPRCVGQLSAPDREDSTEWIRDTGGHLPTDTGARVASEHEQVREESSCCCDRNKQANDG